MADESAAVTKAVTLTRRAVALAGHRGDEALAHAGLADSDPAVRSSAIGALERLGLLQSTDVVTLLRDPDGGVRRRAAEAAARFRDVELLEALDDPDWSVVEMACWAIGEHEEADSETIDRLAAVARQHDDALAREAAVAALGAVGDARALPAILDATTDKAAVRRRAAIALAPFDGPEVEAALRRLLSDRDWQTRQIAEDLLDVR
jgi:HEAT repeat protein